MYTRLIKTIAQRQSVKYHLYADDTWLYKSLNPDNGVDFSFSLGKLEYHIADIPLSIAQYIIKLNDIYNNNNYYCFQ